MKEELLSNVGTIRNAQPLLRILSSRSGIPIKDIDIRKINQNAEEESCNMYYLDGLAPAPNEEEASLRFIFTGYQDEKKEPLFISMDRTGDTWSGGKTGTIEELQKLFEEDGGGTDEKESLPAGQSPDAEDAPPAEKNPHGQVHGPEADKGNPKFPDGGATENAIQENKPISKNKTASSGNKNTPAEKQAGNSAFIQVKETAKINIPKDILAQEKSWTSGEQGTDALKYYIDCACTNAYAKAGDNAIIANGREEYVINSGIMDKFGHDIYICFHVAKKGASAAIDRYEAITGKASLLKKGFSREEAKTPLICTPLYDAKSDLERIRNAKIEDFELSDWPSLDGMLRKKKRLLECLNIAITPYDLSSHLEQSIEMGLHISQIDPGYVRPCYDLGTAQVHYLMPLHMAASLQEPAEFMTEIRYDGEFFLLHDLLLPEEAYIKSKAIAPYSAVPA